MYTPAFEGAVDAICDQFTSEIYVKKGDYVKELAVPNNDFFFLSKGYLKEMYKNLYTGEDELFNFTPPSSVFVNEDTLYFNKRPTHFYLAYTDITFLRLSYGKYVELLKEFPEIHILYISGTADIQKNRRNRLAMLRMNSTIEKIKWVKEVRPDIYFEMDRTTLAQFIGVSRASLYRAFDKLDMNFY